MSEQPMFRENLSGHAGSNSNSDSKGSSMFASLTAGIMARKGEAAPASAHLDGVSIHSHGVVREEEYESPVAPPPVPVPEVVAVPAMRAPENVPGVEEPPRPKRLSAKEARRRAIRRANLAGGDCCELALPAAVTQVLPEGPRSTVTTRLDPERVRKLKILAARMGTSNQKIMLAALDHYLEFAIEELASECPCLARSMATGE